MRLTLYSRYYLWLGQGGLLVLDTEFVAQDHDLYILHKGAALSGRRCLSGMKFEAHINNLMQPCDTFDVHMG